MGGSATAITRLPVKNNTWTDGRLQTNNAVMINYEYPEPWELTGCFPERSHLVFKGVGGRGGGIVNLLSKLRLSPLRLFVLNILEVTLQDETIKFLKISFIFITNIWYTEFFS